mgnify:CR=1 FL=1
MNKEEIYKRIMVCEKKERDFLEVGNTRTANRYHNEIQKWEEILNQLNPKMEKELNEYRRGYYKQKEVIDDCKEDISNLLDIINKNCNELKCTSDEWLVIQKYQDKEVSE